jgi:type I restriction enzyme R subunit
VFGGRNQNGLRLQQAKEYALMLGLKFAYATNGEGIVEFDFTTGKECFREAFPSPQELWSRYCRASKIEDEQTKGRILSPYYHSPGKAARYYQEIAINRSIEAILQGKKRVLLTMATGTGKTFVAFQICWKLWESGWNARAEKRRPIILYLADRNILIDDPKDKTLTPSSATRRRPPPSWMRSFRLCWREPFGASSDGVAKLLERIRDFCRKNTFASHGWAFYRLSY